MSTEIPSASSASTSSRSPDPRLFCDCCGELGQVVTVLPCTTLGETECRFMVTCQRGGKMCCRTQAVATKENAIECWERMQD